MKEKTLRVLEYYKITDMLCAECSSVLTRQQAEKLVPFADERLIEQELSSTDEAMTVLLKKGAPPFGNFYDISAPVRLAAKDGTLTQKELLEIAYNLGSARKTAAFLSSDLPPLPYIDGLSSAISDLKALEEEIQHCVISEDELADDASPELRRLRRAIVRQNESIKVKIQQIVGSSENRQFLQDAIVTMRQGRYVIPVKLEHRSRLSGIVHDQSASGQTVFIEPQTIVNMNNELRELELAEKQEIIKILRDLSDWVGRSEKQVLANQDILQKLDYAFAKAKLADRMNAVRPVINGEGYVYLRKARHPLIDPKKVVPTNISIGKDYRTLVVTGPNTGGKTVTLKTAGLLCLMAQSGLFIPAGDGSSVCVFRNVFADIGDEQSIEQSLSTFSSHMVNIVSICEEADDECLVLADELGAGTDPSEGAALAMAILDELYNKGARTIATTHYTELKKYALSTPGVQNASMEFNVETLSPTYRLTIGVPGKSNAFEIAGKLGLPEAIIGKARGLMDSGDLAFEDVITTIENDRKSAEDDRRRAEEMMAEMQKQKEKMDQLRAKLEEKKAQYIEDAKAEAAEIVAEAQAEVLEIQNSIKEAKDQADEETRRALNRSIEEGKKRLREKKKKLEKKQQPEVLVSGDQAVAPDQIVPGIRVNVLTVGQKGLVLSAADEKGDFQVQIGQMKLTVNVDSVTLVKENVTDKQREKTKYSRLSGVKAMTVPLSFNVVGQNLDDALMNVEKYLDDAFLAHLSSVTIIHGRGAGVLQQGIRKMLRSNKNVDSYRKGAMGEGGDGVTVVTLKK